jgi:hypothetical protein
MLTRKDGIASAGYRFGKELAETEEEAFDQRIEEDPLFMVKFIHLLDAVFQRFCMKLATFAPYRDPLLEAKKADVDLLQVRTIESALGNFISLGHVPLLPIPQALTKYRRSGTTKEKDEDKKRKLKEAQATDSEAGKGKGKPGQPSPGPTGNSNPEVVAAWKLPDGKTFPDFFGKSFPENQKRFPRIEHHMPGRGKNRLCLKWFCIGKCSNGSQCPFSHLPLARLNSKDREEIDLQFLEIYK